MRNRALDAFFLTLVIIGSIYLGMVGLFGIDLFAVLLSRMPIVITRVLFGLIGVAGLYAVTYYRKLDDHISEINNY